MMKQYFDRRPNAFRVFLFILMLAPLSASFMNFYFYLNRGSDENIFSDSASTVYIFKSLPAQIINHPKKFLQDDLYYGIQIGDLLLEINGVPIQTAAEANELLASMVASQMVRLKIQRPTQRSLFLEFQVLKSYLASDFVRDIPKSVYTYSIPQGGAADRAGLRVGDLIYKIDNRLFSSSAAADILVRRSLAGQKLQYDLIRNNQAISVNVTMARVQISLLVLFFQLCGFAWIFVGLFIGFSRPQLAAGRLLSIGLFLCGVSFTLMVNRGSSESDWQSFVLLLFTFPTHFFGLATLFYGTYYFPFEVPKFLNLRWLPYGYLSIALVGTLFSIYSSANSYFFWILLFILYHFGIEFYFRRYISQQHRSQSKILNIATLIGLSVIIIWAIFGRFLPNLWSVFLPCLTISVILAGYLITIARYRLLGFQIRRSIQYALVSSSWMIFLAIGFLFALWMLSTQEINLPNLSLTASTIEIGASGADSIGNQNQGIFVGMLLALGLGLSFWIVARRGLSWLQQKFHRSAYDFHKVTQELHELMATRRPLDSLAKGMVTKLAKLMFLKQVGVLFYRNQQVIAFKEAFPPPHNDDPLCMEVGASLCDTMKRYHSELCVDYLDPKLKDQLSKNGYRYIYPIYSKDQLVGLLMVGEKLSENTFRHEDFAFLSTTTRQASVAIENGFLYEKVTEQERFKQELDIARRIQLSSLPQKTPEVSGLDIAGTSVPALEVGGDFYDYYAENQDTLTVLVGDVSGKGTSAALYMSKLQGIFRTLMQDHPHPLPLFKKANPIIHQELDKASFLTALGARFDMKQGMVSYSRAGHLPLVYLAGSSQKATYLTTKGIALGLEQGNLLRQIQEEITQSLQPGDLFIMLSDGITEAQNQYGEQYGEERILGVVEQNRNQTPQALLETILDQVNRFSGAFEQHDDQTIVVIRIRDTSKTQDEVG